MDPELRRFVREEIRQQLNIILNAEAGINDSQKETINKLFPGMASIPDRPIVHPYGFVSRAVQGIISVTARVGDHVANRMTIGHRDKDKPVDLNEGESVVYSKGGMQARVQNDAFIGGIPTGYQVKANKSGAFLGQDSGYQIKLEDGDIMVGKNGVFETVVVGDTLKTLLSSLIQEIAIHTHTETAIPGNQTAPPTDAAQFTNLKTNYLDNSKILAKDGGRF